MTVLVTHARRRCRGETLRVVLRNQRHTQLVPTRKIVVTAQKLAAHFQQQQQMAKPRIGTRPVSLTQVQRNQRHTQLVPTRKIVVTAQKLAAHFQQQQHMAKPRVSTRPVSLTQVQQVAKQRFSRRQLSCHSRPPGLAFHQAQPSALVKLSPPGSTWTKAMTPRGLG